MKLVKQVLITMVLVGCSNSIFGQQFFYPKQTIVRLWLSKLEKNR